MQEVTSKNFLDSIQDGIVIVNIGASWCPDCRFIDPIMKALETEYNDKIKFFKVDFSKEEQLKDTLQIKRIPTLIFYKDGNEIAERIVEPKSQATIEEVIKTILK